jgi:hypothetical protein
METNINEIQVNGIVYVVKGSEQGQPAVNSEGLPYVVIRAKYAGVFAGYLKSKKDNEVTLVDARRLWYWSGASSCTQIAIDGVAHPDACKFTQAIAEQTIAEWIEILPATEKARKCIQGVKAWKQ